MSLKIRPGEQSMFVCVCGNCSGGTPSLSLSGLFFRSSLRLRSLGLGRVQWAGTCMHACLGREGWTRWGLLPAAGAAATHNWLTGFCVLFCVLPLLCYCCC
ncbi:hypothetical protein LZ30DRAFT_710061 [Colletotrichum cereale]|nr:hypothetical protein LZ30DRAFT_710061 [Colletotrichum cereale]